MYKKLNFIFIYNKILQMSFLKKSLNIFIIKLTQYYKMILFLLVLSVVSLEISMIPPTGTPPDRNLYSSAVYDSQYNRIITIGGYNLNENEYFSSINTYDLSTNL